MGRLNIEKLVQVVDYELRKYGGRLNYTKLIKILYLADRNALSECGLSITGDSYYSLENGPILSALYDLIQRRYNDFLTQSFWDARFSKDGYDLVSLSDRIPHGEMSEYEMSVIDDIDGKFHLSTYGQMIEYVHNPANCPEWDFSARCAKRIDRKSILLASGWSEQEVAEWEEEERIFEEEEKILSSLSEVSVNA